MFIERFINPVYSSNTYILDINSEHVIIIDPGNLDINPLLYWLNKNRKTPSFVILTHEHLDHIAGVISLRKHFNFQPITSEFCRKNIADTKKNFSKYHELIPEFKITLPVTSIIDNEILNLNGFNFKFVLTPGHSEGSMCILLDNVIFTGDTLLQTPTPLNLPGSNKKEYAFSIQKLFQYLDKNTIIYPGHGDPFQFNQNLL